MVLRVLSPFEPLPFLKGAHIQTLLGTKLSFCREPPSSTRVVALADGDRIALEVSTPATWRPEHRTVLMLHGLCGCHRSSYLVRLARRLHGRGLRAVRMNLRGCGSGRGLARRIYHSGRSEDVREVLEALRGEHPRSPVTLVGFSLGGNIALKLAGELEDGARSLFDQLIAVCPPIDLLKSSERFSLPGNRLYERYFVKRLIADVSYRHRLFPELGPLSLPRRLRLIDFDDIYTAPQCGFESALDYYRRASSAPLLARIRIRGRILFAADDPLIDSSLLEDQKLPENLTVLVTTCGGHLGFLGRPGRPGGYRWMDHQVLDWILDP